MDYEDYLSGKRISNFYFKGKNDLLKRILKGLIKNKNLKILSIGCGTGEELKILKDYGKNYIIDINEKVFQFIERTDYFKKGVGDACNLPFNNNYFDLIIAFDVLEHIENDQLAVNEIYRVLKKKGHFVLSVPSCKRIYSTHDVALGHFRRYEKNELSKLLSKFKIELFFWNSFLFPIVSIMRIIKKDSKQGVDNFTLTPLLDYILTKELYFENYLINKRIRLPIGISLIGICYKE